MTQEKLLKRIQVDLHFLKGAFHLRGKYPEEEIDRLFSLESMRLIDIINQHVAEVIGEDEEVLKGSGKPGFKDSRFDPYAEDRNELRAEQRKRAGLEENL